MTKLRDLSRKEVLIKYCFAGLSERFSSEAELREWFERIGSDKKKDQFLKVASRYAALVKRGDWHVTLPDCDPVVDYFTTPYKFIPIFSLIESLSELIFIDFHQYLERKKTGVCFPLTKKGLNDHYQQYKKDYGAIRRCIAFFEGLPPERQSLFVSKLQVNGKKVSIRDLAEYLYRLRSKFIHEAEFVHPVTANTWIGFQGITVTVCSLTLRDIMKFFEEGLLLWFEPKET